MLLVQVLLVFVVIQNCHPTVNLIRDLLQYNVAGHPVVHKEVEYVFDPDDGVKRAQMYQEINGVHGENAIRRLGLGIDGKDKERLQEQKIRDIHLEQDQ